MALTKGFARNNAKTPLDQRLADMATIVCNADGSPRAGVLGAANASIVSALATWNFRVQAAEFVTSKGKADGVMIYTNNGAVDVPIAAGAPASNSRIDVLWTKHEDNTTGDAASLPIFGVTSGAAAASPVKPAIPTGAEELATLRAYSGTTGASGGANILANTYRMTAARGAVVPFRTKTELDAWTTATVGQHALVLATGASYEHVSSVGWVPDAIHFSYLKTGTFNWPTADTDHTWDVSPNEGVLAGFTTTDRITFTCVVAGTYRIAGQITANTGTSPLNISVFKNGVAARIFNGRADSTAYISHRFDCSLAFAEGDAFKIRLQAPAALTPGVGGVQSFLNVDSFGR